MIRVRSATRRPIVRPGRLGMVVLAVVLAAFLAAPGVAHAAGAPTTTTFTVDPHPATAGQTITLNAQVSSDAGIPTGTVAFYNGSALVTSAALAPAAGSTTTSVAQATTLLPGGTTYALQAFYESNSVATYTNSSSVVVPEPVGSPSGPASTTTTLSTSSARAITSRQAVVLAAHVAAPSGAPTPTGQVAFLDNGVILGTVQLATGAATLTSGDFAPGTDTIEADYRGNSTNAASSATITLVVAATGSPVSASATTLSISTTPTITSREPVTLTARVAADGAATPSGSVTFRDNDILLGTARLDADGSARLTTGGFLSGVNTIDADYPGGRTIEPSSATVTFVVTVASAAALPTHTTLATSTARTVTSRQSVTLTVRVTAPHGDARPDGVVVFVDNGVLLGTALLDAKGIARMTTGGFRPGPNAIEADYRGSEKDAPSLAKVTLVVPSPPAATERTAAGGSKKTTRG